MGYFFQGRHLTHNIEPRFCQAWKRVNSQLPMILDSSKMQASIEMARSAPKMSWIPPSAVQVTIRNDIFLCLFCWLVPPVFGEGCTSKVVPSPKTWDVDTLHLHLQLFGVSFGWYLLVFTHCHTWVCLLRSLECCCFCWVYLKIQSHPLQHDWYRSIPS